MANSLNFIFINVCQLVITLTKLSFNGFTISFSLGFDVVLRNLLLVIQCHQHSILQRNIDQKKEIGGKPGKIQPRLSTITLAV